VRRAPRRAVPAPAPGHGIGLEEPRGPLPRGRQRRARGTPGMPSRSSPAAYPRGRYGARIEDIRRLHRGRRPRPQPDVTRPHCSIEA
jgi:hypothetical protein